MTKTITLILVGATLLTAVTSAHSEQAPSGPALQDSAELLKVAEKFLLDQTRHRPGKSSVTVAPPNSLLKLAACTATEPFLPPGGKTLGRTTVGIKCNAPKNWTIYLSAQVQTLASYVTAASPIRANEPIALSDLAVVDGDLASISSSVITDPTLIEGKSLSVTIAAGTPIKKEMLKLQMVVFQGQTVRVLVKGRGYQVSAEGAGMQNAPEGQTTSVRLSNGQVISGTAKQGGIVEVIN